MTLKRVLKSVNILKNIIQTALVYYTILLVFLQLIFLQGTATKVKDKCYGPYKQDSTDTQTGSKTGQDQCARGGTDRTSGAMG